MAKSIKKLADLIPDDKNANRGTERGAALLENSLRDYGAGRSILLDKRGKIIAGNKTVEQAGSIGLDDVIVVQTDGTKLVAVQRMDLDLDKDSRAKALAIADNRVGQVSLEWDPKVLAELGEEIDLGKFWSDEELNTLLSRMGSDTAEAPEAQIERADELRDLWQTVKGQLWQIPAAKASRGVHRLLCGDSTSRANVSRLMGDVRAQMAFTDPPWNVAIGQDSNPRHRQREGLKNNLSSDNFCQFLEGFSAFLPELVDGDIYVVMSSSQWPTIDAVLRNCGLHWSGTLIWVKDSFVLGRSNYHRRFEPIWYCWNAKGKSSFCEARDLDDVWEIARPKVSEEHPTMKPLELPARAIQNSSAIGEVVYEPFSGSGSTMCAAESMGRLCYGIDIEPKYVAVALQRMQDMGLEPRLVS
ncbi:MAG: DNA modification methylase [Terriglobales bacterium]